jgi:hypothetical protein
MNRLFVWLVCLLVGWLLFCVMMNTKVNKDQRFPVTPRGQFEVEVRLHMFVTSAIQQVDASGQFHSTAVLTPEKEPGTQGTGGWRNLRTVLEERKFFSAAEN